jgi:hypothetical protein
VLVEQRVASDVHGVRRRDTSGMLASFGRAFSGDATASTSTLAVLGDVEERGGELGHQGQGREGRRGGGVRQGGDMAGMAMP